MDIGKKPVAAALVSSDITDGIISTAKIAADAVTAAKIPDDAISDEHLDATAITGQTELAVNPATTDEIIISDAGTLKRIDAKWMGNYPAFIMCHNTEQTMSHNTLTRLEYNSGTPPLNPDSIYANDKFTVPTGGAGAYIFHLMIAVEDRSANPPLGVLYYIKPCLYVNAHVFSSPSVALFPQYSYLHR